MTMKITVKAGPHARVHCPVKVACELPLGQAVSLKAADGTRLPAQVIEQNGATALAFIIDSLPAASEMSYELCEGALPQAGVTLRQHDDKIDVLYDGALFTTLHYGKQWAKPFLFPVIGPYGSNMTRSYPMVENVEGEPKDHPHQKSFWTAWGDVNGTDGWGETEGHGRILCKQARVMENGLVRARVILSCDWLAGDGSKQLEEEREYVFHSLPANARAVDMAVRFTATNCPVTFGDTKEGGLCSIRVATSMDASGAGTIVNSYGAIGEQETWGKRAEWCDYFGPVPGGVAGICIMDNPANHCYPTYWHVRNYGLMTANPFGLSYFLDDKTADGSLNIAQGAKQDFCYRVLFHAGCHRHADVAGKYHDYVNPPKVSIVKD
jgi:hypothetical protein